MENHVQLFTPLLLAFANQIQIRRRNTKATARVLTIAFIQEAPVDEGALKKPTAADRQGCQNPRDKCSAGIKEN